MIDHAAVRNHLALERRSMTEIATGLTICAVTGATLYNVGFFAPIEWSLISLLSVQDLLVGVVVAAVPMAMAAWIAFIMGKIVAATPKRKRLSLLLGTPALFASITGFFYFYAGPGQWTLGHLASGYLLIGIAAGGLNMVVKWRHMSLLWLLFSLIYIPTALGMADSATAAGSTRAISEVETDRGVIVGRVMRVTSSYILIAKDNAIITLSMNKVREIRRRYAHSLEADFLSGQTASEPDVSKITPDP